MPIYDPLQPQPYQSSTPSPATAEPLPAKKPGPIIYDPFSPSYTLPPPKPQHQLSDLPKTLGAGLGELVGNAGYLANKLTGGASDRFFEQNVGRSLTDIGADVADYYRSKYSPAMQQSAAKRFISDKPGEIFGEALSDPYAIAAGVGESIPSMLPMIGVAGKAAKAAKAFKTAQALARGATAAEAATAGITAAGRAATAAGGVTEGALSGAQVARDVGNQIQNAPEEVLAYSSKASARSKPVL